MIFFIKKFYFRLLRLFCILAINKIYDINQLSMFKKNGTIFYFYTYDKIPIVRIMYVNKLFVVFIIKYLIIFFVPYIFHLKLLIANKMIINYFTLK